ncbi:oxidative stress-induced growth inhibitor 1-like isoform X1 [Periplaneta americana]|uniref:oxidative stress-induced growth inhibitor 1-like isoform X1 n=2 Tax=Periplaneta americana TaxID=6978 RepID=UPI0037E7D7AA
MRDYSVQGVSIPDDAVYKEVVVIGNGPSGIALSYLLAGNWPYYNGAVHPDEMLTTRLSGAPSGRSIIQQDLRFLSQGLEGRSNNPVSLLMDTLNHPCADLGLELPSLLEWRHHPECQVDHIVLGKGPPGGSWQAMDGNVLTISLSSWMELPGVEFRGGSGPAHSRDGRASVSSVAQYYHDYVHSQTLARFFRNGCVVTSVRPLDISHSQSGDIIDPETGVQYCQPQAMWRVEGFDLENGGPFCYICRRVVLATGAADLPNRLGVPGELANPTWVLHDLRSLEAALDRLVEEEEGDREGVPTEPRCDPVLIVGAGLSAADAVIAARFRSLPILHVFRKKAGALGKQLPENMYPEYHKVHQMMGDGGASYPCYTALAEHRVLEISSDHKVCVVGSDNAVSVHQVSVVAVLIGSRPDLNFLPPGLSLGLRATESVDCRSNPVDVDPYTHRAVRAPPGMYALGPLAGDNFVRFLQGGAVAIASHIHKELHHTAL